jgi:hypothetical protein
MNNFLKSLDLLGIKPGMYVNSEKSYKTALGGFMCCLWYCGIIFSIIFFGREMWEKKRPITNMSTETNHQPNIVFYYKNFEFVFALEDPNSNNAFYFDETIFTPLTYLIYYDKGVKKVPLKFSTCNSTSFDEENRALFETYDYKGGLCFDKNQNITISGLFGMEGYTAIQIQFYRCVNTTTYNKCKPENEIEKYLNYTFVTVYAIQYYVQTNDYEQPFKKGIKDYFFPVSLNSYTDTSFYLKEINMESDSGLLQESYQEMDGFTHQSFTSQISNLKQQKFASIVIQLTDQKDVYFRSYMKLQNLFALVGGFINFLKLGITIILNYYHENVYFDSLFKEFVDKSNIQKFLIFRILT